MMTKKNARRQFRAFRRMAENRFDDMGTGQKMAGAAVAGLLLGLTSMVGRSIFDGRCCDCAAKMDKAKMDKAKKDKSKMDMEGRAQAA